jgi:hypothetical protein
VGLLHGLDDDTSAAKGTRLVVQGPVGDNHRRCPRRVAARGGTGGDAPKHLRRGRRGGEAQPVAQGLLRRSRWGAELRQAATNRAAGRGGGVSPLLALDAAHRVPAVSSTVVLAETAKAQAMEAP